MIELHLQKILFSLQIIQQACKNQLWIWIIGQLYKQLHNQTDTVSST